jgi:hypothetical protein
LRLHPITQLMLLAALLIFAGLGLGLYGFGRFAVAAGPEVLDIPLLDRVAIFARAEAPMVQRFAWGVAALVMAFWLEALARGLAALEQHNSRTAGT